MKPNLPAREVDYSSTSRLHFGASSDFCRDDPGFEVDVNLFADLRTLTQLYLGDLSLERARALGKVELDGPRELIPWYAAMVRPQQVRRRQPAARRLISAVT